MLIVFSRNKIVRKAFSEYLEWVIGNVGTIFAVCRLNYIRKY